MHTMHQQNHGAAVQAHMHNAKASMLCCFSTAERQPTICSRQRMQCIDIQAQHSSSKLYSVAKHDAD